MVLTLVLPFCNPPIQQSFAWEWQDRELSKVPLHCGHQLFFRLTDEFMLEGEKPNGRPRQNIKEFHFTHKNIVKGNLLFAQWV